MANRLEIRFALLNRIKRRQKSQTVFLPINKKIMRRRAFL
ncbi:hypothetical protein NEILACOT_04646 [Neisseria lactamica ATCC 23970]|uniref:Uncharacterized protein n=1 Tax=Neisseria lactamica ATCC 23970 TaxID=546265 RepID=D0WAS5_NEILA|nr:hypothetical protein NEILACOT_04646 [Neisseria lactamica ATCC 23970]